MMTAAMLFKGASGGGGGGGTSGSATITIDHTQVGASDLTDFPVLLKGTFSNLADVAHGGQLNDVKNFSIYTDSGYTTLADFERVTHDLTTGYIEYWFRVGTLSHTADTLLYPKWDPANTTDNANPTGVWSNSFEAVFHYGDGTTLSVADSTSHARNGTLAHTSGFSDPTAGTGKVGGGITFSGASGTQGTTVQFRYDGTALNNFTVMFWINITSGHSTVGIWNWHGGLPLDSAQIQTPFALIHHDTNTLKFYVDGNYRQSVTLNAGSGFHHIALTLSGGTTWKFYLDGAQSGSTYTGGMTNHSAADNVDFGSGYNGGITGVGDEHMLASVALTSDWIAACYANQNGSTFCTMA